MDVKIEGRGRFAKYVTRDRPGVLNLPKGEEKKKDVKTDSRKDGNKDIGETQRERETETEKQTDRDRDKNGWLRQLTGGEDGCMLRVVSWAGYHSATGSGREPRVGHGGEGSNPIVAVRLTHLSERARVPVGARDVAVRQRRLHPGYTALAVEGRLVEVGVVHDGGDDDAFFFFFFLFLLLPLGLLSFGLLSPLCSTAGTDESCVGSGVFFGGVIRSNPAGSLTLSLSVSRSLCPEF